MSETTVEPVTDNSPEAYLQATAWMIARAIKLYYAVRDGVRYDPYSMQLVPEELGAVRCLAHKVGFCIPKAALLAASARALGIPARVGYADVKNHLATGKLIEMMGTDIFIWHGYTDLFLEGKWVKATPAFNIELCDKFRVLPLEFDGREDSLFHPFDADDSVRPIGVCSTAPSVFGPATFMPRQKPSTSYVYCDFEALLFDVAQAFLAMAMPFRA